MLHIGRGSSGLKAELVPQFKHWRVGDIAVSHQFSATVFGEGLLEQWFEEDFYGSIDVHAAYERWNHNLEGLQ